MVTRYIPKVIKQTIAILQNNKCANSPNKSNNFDGYKCLLWKHNKGYFDNSGYQMTILKNLVFLKIIIYLIYKHYVQIVIVLKQTSLLKIK